MGLDSLYCFKWSKISKSCRDLDLDQTMPNVELVRAIFIYYNMFKFQVTQTHRQTDRRTDRHQDTHTDGHEYSIVAVDKPQL